jgi:magnesium transporter
MRADEELKPEFNARTGDGSPVPPGLHKQTAADHLVVRVLRADPRDTVASLRARLASGTGPLDSAEAVWLIDEHKRLVGWVALTRLLAADGSLTLVDIAEAPEPVVKPATDQEMVASLALGHQLSAVPVLDARGHFAGVVPAAALLEVLRREHVEDLHRLAGIGPETEMAREAVEAPPMRGVRHRLPWLLFGLAGSLLTALVMASFQASLEARIAVAYFIPAIVYLADAVGTQSEAIAIRSLSLSRIPLRRLLPGEMRTGLLIGLTLALLALGPIWWWFDDGRLALAVAIALLAATACATTIGFTLPWILARSGRDPAFGSGPIATILQDLLSLLIYFWVVSLLLE